MSVYKLKYRCDKNVVKLFSLVFEISCSQAFEDALHRLTHERTYRKTECLLRRKPSAAERRHKKKVTGDVAGHLYSKIKCFVICIITTHQ